MKHKLTIGVGTASLIMIFVALILISLALLSMMTARADQTLTNKYSHHTLEYNTADNEAEECLFLINQTLQEAKEEVEQRVDKGISKPTEQINACYQEVIREKLQALPKLELQEDEQGQLIVSYQIRINEVQKLKVQVSVGSYEAKVRSEVISWQVENSKDWEYEEPNFGEVEAYSQ